MADGMVALNGGTTDSTHLLFWAYPRSFCLLNPTISTIGRLAGPFLLLLLRRRLPLGRPEAVLRRLHHNHRVKQATSESVLGPQSRAASGSILRLLVQDGL